MSEPVRVYLPADSGAKSVGSDAVARAIAAEAARRSIALDLIRTGSRGLYWLEPMVEVALPVSRQRERGPSHVEARDVASVPQPQDAKQLPHIQLNSSLPLAAPQGEEPPRKTRVAYGPVAASDVPSLFGAGFLDGRPHPLRLGAPQALPYLENQTRLTFARCGIIDPLSLDDYESHGGWAALRKALALAPETIIADILQSGLRGRGGAGFPAGIKWQTALEAPGETKYVVCNADEGDSGTFADRMLMEGDPFTLIEGMIIAGLAVGAHEGFIYIRSEYPDAIRMMREATLRAERAGWLGDDIAGSHRAFRITIRRGAGSYICGEESAMLDSLEGKRGIVRAKPPIPAVAGLFGKPTLVHNVLSLASVPWIVAHGGQAYQDIGAGRSRGTQPFQLAGNVRRGGLVELPFGVSLRRLIEEFGGGTASGRPVRAVQVGGPLGAYLPASMLDIPLEYEALAEAEAMLGHGGIVVFDDRVDMARQARFAMEFCALESCGKCTPCRIGAVRGVEIMDKVIAGGDRARQIPLLQDLCELMRDGSLCAMGGLTPMPVLSALKHFPEDFDR